MLTIEKDFNTFFSFIGDEEKQKRFNSLIKEKNLSLEELDLIFQTIKPRYSAIHSEISRVISVKPVNAMVAEINKGLGTKESPILRSYLWWTESGCYIGETVSLSYGLSIE